MGTQRRPGPSGSQPIRRRGNTARRTRSSKDPDIRIVSVQETPVWKKPPVMIGAAAGFALLLIIIIAASTGSTPPPRTPAADASPPRPAPKPILPNVSHLEDEGRTKCQEGAKIVRIRLQATAGSPREAVRTDLEKGLKLLFEGLKAYREATRLARKQYDIGDFELVHARGVKVLCDDDLEKEGHAKCDEGLAMIQSREAFMKGGAKLSDEEQSSFRTDLERGIALIREGMNLFDRSYQVSGHRFDTRTYTKAQKAARIKVLELKK